MDFINNIVKTPKARSLASRYDGTGNDTTTNNFCEYSGNAIERPCYVSADPKNAPIANFSIEKIGKPVAKTLRVASLYNSTHELNRADSILLSSLVVCDDSTKEQLIQTLGGQSVKQHHGIHEDCSLVSQRLVVCKLCKYGSGSGRELWEKSIDFWEKVSKKYDLG